VDLSADKRRCEKSLFPNDDIYLRDFQKIEDRIYTIWRIDMFIRSIAVHVTGEK